MNEFKLTINFQTNDQTKAPINFKLYSGQLLYLSADSGLFISNLFEWLEGKRFLPHSLITLEENGQLFEGIHSVSKYIKTVRFSASNVQTGQYYQQRYQASESDNIIKLRDFINAGEDSFFKNIFSIMGLNKLMHESINMLSTGEYIKACIIKTALLNPRVMLIEDPYPGIDQNGRKSLDQLFEHLSNNGTNIVIIGSSRQIPAFVTHCILIQNGLLLYSGEKQFMLEPYNRKSEPRQFVIPENNDIPFINAFQLTDVSVRYDNRLILDHINWTVEKGDKWQLMGNNGSGKSLLLSLVYADNPQVYCNDVYVFDHKRGTGESIWEVKENIGFYSSDMFRYFNKSLTVEETINYIVFQNPYQKRLLQQQEVQFINDLLKYFNFSDNLPTPLYEFSAANQQAVLLIAVIVKNAPLLILDEPFQYFDKYLTDRFLNLIDNYAKNRTLVFVSHDEKETPECISKWFQLSEGKGCCNSHL